MRTLAHATLVLAAVAAAGCSHAPVARLAGPAWPLPPEQPRLQWERSLPDPDRADGRSGFRRFLDTVLGLQPGYGEPALVRPFGLAIQDGRLLVADPDAPAVLRIDLSDASLDPVLCDDAPWGAPMAVVAGPGGIVYVADAGLGTVVVIRAGGRCDRWGSGLLERPAALALIGERLFVADPPRHVVETFSLAGVRGAAIGARGDGDDGFNFPTGLAAAPDGTLLVVDALNFKVKRFGPDGALRASFGEAGDGDGQFVRPKAVAVDARGLIYVTDSERGQVLVFDPRGRFLYAAGEVGDAPGQFSLPAGIAVGADILYVADGQHRRVEAYRFIGDRS
jgi:DNA-binding beta-propeller fold protein YncE